ncbi:hypothetical protein CDG68_18685 [Acinetobacter wuhouensis]|uniref:Uncharacterized protein n=1 Tax=Acinetobacter wuhouensis TaxID=1879050 RepID=A0A3G2T5K8_9GAMM|nr:hypothetical protein CDG68_18685 [Acinetobacter wuhouensis]
MRNIVSQEGEFFFLKALILLRSYLLIPEPYMVQEKELQYSFGYVLNLILTYARDLLKINADPI